MNPGTGALVAISLAAAALLAEAKTPCPAIGEPIQWIADYCMLKMETDDEIAASAWLTTDVDPSLIFGVPPEMMWETVIRSLGIEPMSLAPAPGVQ